MTFNSKLKQKKVWLVASIGPAQLTAFLNNSRVDPRKLTPWPRWLVRAMGQLMGGGKMAWLGREKLIKCQLSFGGNLSRGGGPAPGGQKGCRLDQPDLATLPPHLDPPSPQKSAQAKFALFVALTSWGVGGGAVRLFCISNLHEKSLPHLLRKEKSRIRHFEHRNI